MANFNQVTLIGNLTRDPQLRYTPNQQALCDFGLAINRKWKGGDGQMHEEVCFVDCTAWGRQAETLQKYVTKGQPLFVTGYLRYRTWDGPDGKKRSKLDVTVAQFQFLGAPKGGQGGAGRAPASQDQKRQDTAGAENQAPAAGDEKQAPAAGNDYDFSQDVEDDTIPF